MALVPAVCEAMGLSYIGPDAYGRVICQDKEVSKALAAEAGLKVASHRIVRSRGDLSRLADFPLPYVAKPMWEGSSIGIGPDSLITDHSKGAEVVAYLLEHFKQPVMVETFVAGREVSFCYIEAPAPNGHRSLAELVWGDEPDHFDRHLYDAAHKAPAAVKTVRAINDELRCNEAEAMEQLLQFVGPTGYGRIDGKLYDGEFVFLEMTPDAWLAPTGTFALSFSCIGMSYEDIIAHVLLSARPSPQGRSAND
jgi:D-alanine-D-alanine ligase